MDRAAWAWATDWDTVCRRAAGRRHYNSWRGFVAEYRRLKVCELLARYGFRHGVQARMARELRVSEATVCRDLKVILPLYAPCPQCDSLVPRERAWWVDHDRRPRWWRI